VSVSTVVVGAGQAGLAGHRNRGPGPDGFMSGADVARFLERTQRRLPAT
jgi:hypothetical protein